MAPIIIHGLRLLLFILQSRCACTARVTVLGCVCVCVRVCVCLCVCLSVKSHLTAGAFVCPDNAVAYPAGNRGQKICGIFFETLRSRVMA